MGKITLLSWNVNGLRASLKKGFSEWFAARSPDFLGLQEVKALQNQVPPSVVRPEGYYAYWNSAEKKGYSGVAVFTKRKPKAVTRQLGQHIDMEGRVLGLKFPEYTIYSIYFPNGQRSQDRLDFKMAFYDHFLETMDRLLAKDRKIIVCGDFNTAHQEIDLARPKQNTKRSGFLPEERAWLDKFISHGFIDVFRHVHPEKVQYNYWDLRTRARDRNVGWRIDYFFVSESLLPQVQSTAILDEVQGSDHCPIELTL